MRRYLILVVTIGLLSVVTLWGDIRYTASHAFGYWQGCVYAWDGANGPGHIRFYEDSDNGSSYIQVQAPAAQDDGNVTITLPSHGEVGQTGVLLNTAGTLTTVDTGVSGTLVLDDGTTERITLVFTNGVLTSRTVAATVASLMDWTD